MYILNLFTDFYDTSCAHTSLEGAQASYPSILTVSNRNVTDTQM